MTTSLAEFPSSVSNCFLWQLIDRVKYKWQALGAGKGFNCEYFPRTIAQMSWKSTLVHNPHVTRRTEINSGGVYFRFPGDSPIWWYFQVTVCQTPDVSTERAQGPRCSARINWTHFGLSARPTIMKHISLDLSICGALRASRVCVS